MQDIKLDELNNVTGGTTNMATLREGIKILKTGAKNAFELGGAAYSLAHTKGGFGAMTKTRPWLGGHSPDARIDEIMMSHGMAH